jgi:hypothetical protein
MSALSTELCLTRMAVLERMCGPSCEAVIDVSGSPRSWGTARSNPT